MQENLTYQGKTNELFKIFFLNLFLGIITLGIYHFWGKTRIRRYLASQFSLGNDAFEYTGTGSELFFGMIKAFVLIGIFSLPFIWAIYKLDTLEKTAPTPSAISQIQAIKVAAISDEKVQTKDLKKVKEPVPVKFVIAVLIVGIYVAFYNLFLPFMAVFGSMKYRASRIQWRSIAGYLRGSSIPYAFYGLFHTLLKVLTFGLSIPLADLKLYGYKINRLSFGDQKAAFTAKYGRLFLTNIITLLLALLFIIPITVAFYAAYAADIMKLAKLSEAELQKYGQLITQINIAFLIYLFLVIGLFILIRYWYKAALMRAKYNGLSFGNLSFSSGANGLQYAMLKLGNFFILLLTLGLGYPLAKQRRMKFFTKHVHVLGDVNQFTANQGVESKIRSGEGITSLFDIEVSLF